MFKALVLTILLLISAPALSYIGPGAGISVLGSLMGIVATVLVAIGAILLWPLRKMLRKRKQSGQAETTGAEKATSGDTTSVPSDQA